MIIDRIVKTKGVDKLSLISVDSEKCIKCGLCVKECPGFVLKLGKIGPEEVLPEACMICGHCVAVCPKEAIDHIKTPLTRQTSIKNFTQLTPEQGEFFLRSRRSIRNYKETAVEREKLKALVNVAHFAQSGHNLQGVSYVVIEDRSILQKAVAIVIEAFEKYNVLEHITKLYHEEGVDPILRGAPCLVLTTADTSFERARENSIIALTYLELYAPTLGLGSCWAGMLERIAMREGSPLLELFQIPENKKITGAVMVGYPKYTYPRLVDRNPLDVIFVNKE